MATYVSAVNLVFKYKHEKGKKTYKFYNFYSFGAVGIGKKLSPLVVNIFKG